MKFLAVILLLIVEYYLYRIAFAKRKGTKKNNAIPSGKSKTLPDVMGKSRFVLPDLSKPLQTPATLEKNEKRDEKPNIFAAETKEKRPVAIPAEQMDEVFNDDSNPAILSIPLEENDEEEIDLEAEEAEELHRTLGHEPVWAEGIDYDDLQTVVKVVQEQPDEVNEETGRKLAEIENTELIEQLVSEDEGKKNWIKAVVERNIQSIIPETENENSGTIDCGNFDVADIL